MKRRGSIVFLLLGMALAPVAAQDYEVELQRIVQKEMATGDLKTAIAEYRKLADQASRPGGNRTVAAKALLRLGQVNERLGRPTARAYYEQVMRDFADQQDAVGAASERLAAMGADAPTAPVTLERVMIGASESGIYGFGFAAVTRDGRSVVNTDAETGAITITEIESGRVRRVVDSTAQPGSAVPLGPQPSPDAAQIVYAWGRFENATTELRLIRADGTRAPRTVFRTTETTKSVWPHAWSADGKSILIEFQQFDDTWQFAWLSIADGSVRTLRSLEWRRQGPRHFMRVSLSPDGRYVAFGAMQRNPSKAYLVPAEQTEKRIYILAADGSTESEISNTAGFNDQPVWSRDGSEILFVSDRDRAGQMDLYSIALSNGRAAGMPRLVKASLTTAGRPIMLGLNRDGHLLFSPNFAVSYLSIHDLTAPRGGARNVNAANVFAGSGASWSPDGRYLALTRTSGTHPGASAVAIRTVATGEERELTAPSGAHFTGGVPKWFPDGRALLLTLTGGTAGAAPVSRSASLYRFDLATSSYTQLVHSSTVASSDLSRDGKTLFAIAPEENNGTRQEVTLVAIDLQTGQRSTIYKFPVNISSIGLSPDGRVVAALESSLGRRALGSKLMTVRTDGSGFREIWGPEPVSLYAPEWTPDGKHILLHQLVQQDSMTAGCRVLQIPSDPGEPARQLVETTRCGNLALSPDGSRLVAVERTGEELWALKRATAAAAKF